MVVIVIVFILLVGIVFYFKHTSAAVHASAARFENVEAMKLGKSLLSVPEIQCTALEGGTSCIDGLKLAVWAELMKKERSDGYYHWLFGDANITLHYVTGGEEEIPLYVNGPPTSSALSQVIFLTVNDPVTGDQRFGYLSIQSYGRTVT